MNSDEKLASSDMDHQYSWLEQLRDWQHMIFREVHMLVQKTAPKCYVYRKLKGSTTINNLAFRLGFDNSCAIGSDGRNGALTMY